MLLVHAERGTAPLLTVDLPRRDCDSARWRMLALLACAELLGMALWFTGSAVGPTLARAWSLSTTEVGWLTTAVQLGFVVGTAVSALLNLADVVPARRLFATAAVLGAAANLPLTLQRAAIS